ncbi:hypothetical protein LXL04_032475 [Taraxacum kok-saghyz]
MVEAAKNKSRYWISKLLKKSNLTMKDFENKKVDYHFGTENPVEMEGLKNAHIRDAKLTFTSLKII